MIYLNNAATGFPKPQQVLQAVAACLAAPPVDSRRAEFTSGLDDPVRACQQCIARFFGVRDADRIVFACNATDALNMAIHGLDLDGGHVITTQAEHNSVLRPLATLQRDGKLAVTTVRCNASGCVSPGEVAAAVRNNTRAVVMSHCSNVTGVVQDVHGISDIAHSHRAMLVLDAAQSAGVIPIDVQSLGVDLMAFTGHKSLNALQGIGGLYVREGVELRPWRIGGTGVRSDYPYQPDDMPLRLEAGTPNLPGVVSLHAGLDFIVQTGLDSIAARKQLLIGALLDGIAKLPEVILYGAPDAQRGMLALNVRNVSPEEAGYILEHGFSIVVRSGLHCAPLIHAAIGSHPAGCLRVSPSYFTSDDEIAQFLGALRQVCRVGNGRG